MNNDHQLIALCQNIETLRLSHHLTLEEMVTIMEITTQQLHQIEANDFPDELGVGILFRLAAHFQCKIPSLFSR